MTGVGEHGAEHDEDGADARLGETVGAQLVPERQHRRFRHVVEPPPPDPRRQMQPPTTPVLRLSPRRTLPALAFAASASKVSSARASMRIDRAIGTSCPSRRCLRRRCRHHERLAAELGEDAVRSGRYPRRRNPRLETPISIEETRTSITNCAITPAEVRPLLAQATAASLDEIQAALLDAAVGATRESWTTFTCPDCGKKHRAQVLVPDVRARVGVIEVLLREGLGRPAQAEETADPQLPENVNAVARMSWDDTQQLATVLLVDEIESVLTQGGREALREKLGACNVLVVVVVVIASPLIDLRSTVAETTARLLPQARPRLPPGAAGRPQGTPGSARSCSTSCFPTCSKDGSSQTRL